MLWKATPGKRLRQWLCAKHKVMSGTQRFSEASLYNVLGLVRLTKRTGNFSRGRHRDLSHGTASEAPTDERVGNG
jgi:hypothetical protein